jgi:hypothetical protein
MFRFAEHKCGDCLLKCIDCNAQICPKCLVQCPVGNRCRKCTSRFTSHLLQIDFWVVLRAFGGGFLAGLLFTGLEGALPLGGFFMLLIVYMVGSLAGNLIFKIAKRKLGPKVAITVAVGLVAGSFSASSAWQHLYGTALEQAMTRNPSAFVARAKRSTAANMNTTQNVVGSTVGEDTTKVDDSSGDAAYMAALARTGLAPSPISLSLIVFAFGALSPFLGWGNPIPNLFRR